MLCHWNRVCCTGDGSSGLLSRVGECASRSFLSVSTSGPPSYSGGRPIISTAGSFHDSIESWESRLQSMPQDEGSRHDLLLRQCEPGLQDRRTRRTVGPKRSITR